ncbi:MULTISPECIES: NAD(P)H-dependent glycerol-3-phosphate dehydrogenase [unclassified Undibacterium]|uniref:NAD(P)H-dependent glycerol-3-phosphate dehydrogenase n=1 Tax=unclassified Undibacterium TaxID=2630295 RepID=UPI002AC925A9|nr:MULTISPECIES: NAD(P)H-dependent glycerol-3-phosphate dehydrogenase [unclassified Undibacterium]MEB0139972.1 NAD(P)H-dependent glycerol-3-phosphate dehydrogenase [Undibacterium sp. CCC2.1]MEB0172945.1 NAD(P)H-dependent glycerol-3-phosphate dehydrogenase [Undibacterium sp. CCC1.1]MEB0176772.1 NAD(P)H-dependent glycerol-3-phosphate dehydrogenase [Undibacterium sp. CCC3.4]MEB0216881.1 NAD(P)H-dependent glycerol-3-phosphate dehydrogenase [Undibacterium sp. 5I2]WPX45011.1 NAD(P)H-dependent glycer
MNISVLGAGAWGTAVALALTAKNQVLLWGRNSLAMAALQSQRENHAYLPGFRFPEQLQISAELDAALMHAAGEQGLLVIATSVSGLRETLTAVAGSAVCNVVWLCKGLEEGSQLLPHQIAEQILPATVRTGALLGPSFAQEVARGLPCALTIASTSEQLCQLVVQAMHVNSMRVYSSDDLVGVEVGAAVKNILAIATGVADGLGLGLNARAALITRGLAEISRLVVALGGRAETMMGLTGIGDLILTCTGDLSRNRRVGLALAEGKSLAVIVAELGHVAEGVRCARAVRELARAHGIDMPITEAVAAVLFDGISAADMITRLLARDAKPEGG